MNKIEHSQAMLRKRKMLLVLPLLALPFITMAFWALGGGKTDAITTTGSNQKQGLNLQLPDARLKEDKGLTKLSYYDIATADSAKWKERMRNDPYFKIANITSNEETGATDTDTLSGLNHSPYNRKVNTDPNEEKIMRKLKQLNESLDNTFVTATPKNSDILPVSNLVRNSKGIKVEPDRYEDGMQQANVPEDKLAEPGMQQINGMLDKIMDIQHPDRVRERVQQNSLQHQHQVFPVSAVSNGISISLMTPNANLSSDTTTKSQFPDDKNAFYSTEDLMSADANVLHAAGAIVHETQTVVSGSTVKMRLLNDVYINGTLIRKDNLIYGRASLSGERLTIEIKSILSNNMLFPVALSVCDMDGMDGLYIPGAIERNSAKESSDKAIQSVALNSLDPTIGTQAASAGIEAAKTLLSKKVKLIKVTLKAGYQLLLKDNNNK